VKTINDEVQIQALIDEKRVNNKESSIRHTLKLDDAEGTSCLTNAEIFDGLAKMGYEKLSEKLTFYKAFFSPQWKFLIHTILQCLSAKTTSWNEFSNTMASAIICLATNQKFNFSRYILLITALFNTMLVLAAKEVGLIQANVQLTTIPTEPSTSTPHKKHKSKKQKPQATKVPSPEPSPEHRLPSPSNDPIPAGQDKRIEKLKGRVAKLEEENRVFKELHPKADTAAHVVDKEKSFKHGRIIAEIDEDDVDEEEPAEVEEVLEVVKAAKLMIEVIATTMAKAPKVSVIRRRMGVIIQDPEETTSIVVMHLKVQSKDKGKELNVDINWNAVIEQVIRSERMNDAVMKYQALKRKHVTEAQARKNMIIYFENMAGFKMNYFKGMTYSEIRPLFEKNFNYNQTFLEEVNEEVTLPKKEVEVEAHKEKVKVLKMREDLESLWKLVKERFEKTEPKNYSDDYMLKTLMIMFEKPDVEASVWRDQKGRYGLAKVKSWKLFESVGVHCITFLTTQMFLLVEKRYPLTHFTLEQMLNNVRLKVEEVSKISLELLRLVRRQLIEGYVPA
nr:synaptobrevin, longin-like domain protein [Tanacetum cinerariifolium]